MGWLKSIKSGIIRAWRTGMASAVGFWEDDCYTKASTLTFYTLQSLVPFLAAALAIAKGFGFEEYLESLLKTAFAEQREILNYAIEIALSMLKVISSGEIVGIGVILLLWTNINLVGYIELSFNQVWKVKISRSLFQKVKDFSFAVVVFPLIFVASSSATVFFKAQIDSIPYFAPFNQYVLHQLRIVLPWVLSCVLFGGLYFLIPNAKLRVVPRLIASVIAGSAFQLWQLVFINLQVYIFSYNVVYGAFALLPLFLIWLQFSWLIALAGAEISVHIENYNYYARDLAGSEYTGISRCELALLILHECMTTFYQGKAPMTLTQLSEKLGVSEDLVASVLATMEKEEILVSFRNRDGEVCHHPLHDPSRLKLLSVIDIIEHQQENDIVVPSSDLLERIRGVLHTFHQTAEASALNVALCDFFRIK